MDIEPRMSTREYADFEGYNVRQIKHKKETVTCKCYDWTW